MKMRRKRKNWIIIAVIFSWVFQVNVELIAQDEESGKPVPVRMEVVNNPGSTEFSPTISADGRTLIFESDREGDEMWKLYQSTRNSNGTWSAPESLDKINAKCEFIAGPNLSYDGNTLYYAAYIDGVSNSEDIYYSVREGRDWSAPIRMKGRVNSDDGYEGFPSISSDERQFYFISINGDYKYDKKNKEDCFNIYVMHKDLRGNWGNTELLPEIINSGCVRDPKIMADNRTLLYSKLIPGVKGKFNLYQSQLQSDGTWSEPITLDYVNTDKNNLSPTIPAAGDTMYYFSDGDLYTIHIPPEYRQFFNATIWGYVRNPKTREPVEAEIIIRDAKSLEVLRTVKSNKKDGRYSIIFNAGTNYKIEYKKQGYLSQYEDYNLYYLDGYLEEKKDIMLRSEADVGLMVFDKDLKIAIPADITVSADGVVINSFKIENYDEKSYTLELDINMNYTIVASAENYISDSIQINTSTTNTSKIKLMMEAEKVAYTFNVKDLKTKKKIRARLTFKNNDRDEIIEGFSDETHYLRLGDQYQVLASGDRGYLYASKTIDVTEQGAIESATEDMFVNPVGINANLIMNNITFETNSSDLSPGSLLELEQVINFMNLNPNVSIEISAHSDDVGSDSYNLQLSSRRAASAKKYLVNSNVPESRMQSVGYGETQPLVPNDTEENRSKNRRVELKIIAI